MTVMFSEPAVSGFFFAAAHAGAAELKLEYALEQGLEAAVVAGDPGLGKTTLLRRLARRVAEAGDVVVDIFFPQIGVDDLLAILDAELEQHVRTRAAVCGESRDVLLRRITDHMRQLADDGRRVVLLIDDAHCIRESAVFEALHLLLNLRQRERLCLTIVLAGQKSLLADLVRLPALVQRIGVTATLAPFDAATTAEYVRHRLHSERPDDADRFPNETLVAVHDYSEGVPRRIDRLCEMALLVASLDDRRVVTVRDIEQVAADAGLPGNGTL